MRANVYKQLDRNGIKFAKPLLIGDSVDMSPAESTCAALAYFSDAPGVCEVLAFAWVKFIARNGLMIAGLEEHNHKMGQSYRYQEWWCRTDNVGSASDTKES